MFARTLLLAALGAEAVLAAPNLAERWNTTSTSGSGSDNSTNGTSTNGTIPTAPGPVTNVTNITNSSSSAINDTQILQFALNLEHIENTFYTQGLNQFNESDFEAAGFGPDVRGRFAQIAEHEATHVQLLTSILGDDAPEPCNYTFPFTDPVSFASLSFALESAGESAYLGASGLIKNKTALSIAGTILTVEARQAAWVSAAALNSTPWNGPFDTPLNASAIFSLASQFITSCPSTNPPLPVVPLPVLSVSPSNATVNQSITVSLTGAEDFSPSNIPIVNSTSSANSTDSSNSTSTPLYVAYFHGFNVSFSEVSSSDNTTTIPDGLAGLVYASLVSTNETTPSPDTTLSGLAVITIPVPAAANNSLN